MKTFTSATKHQIMATATAIDFTESYYFTLQVMFNDGTSIMNDQKDVTDFTNLNGHKLGDVTSMILDTKETTMVYGSFTIGEYNEILLPNNSWGTTA